MIKFWVKLIWGQGSGGQLKFWIG